jgi:hypothetical protein
LSDASLKPALPPSCGAKHNPRVPELAIYYEHPTWFLPLFEALRRRGVDYIELAIQDHVFDPAHLVAPAKVVLNRLAMSSFVRQPEHAIFYSQALLSQWSAAGARVINGAEVLAIDANKARHLILFRSLGLDTPATRVVHQRADLARVASELRFPLMVKANVGGSGANMLRYDSLAELAEAAASGLTPSSIDGVTLVQEYLPARDGRVFRCETLNGRFLYAIAIDGAGSTFDLCPADVCLADKPTLSVTRFAPSQEIITAVEAIAQRARLDVGGIEYMIDDRDGRACFYDFNALSNFVANPVQTLGFDPHDKLVDFVLAEMEAQ